MIRCEFRKLFSRSINRILLLALLVIAVAFSFFSIWSVKFVDKYGNVHNGLSAPRKLTEVKLKYKGALTSDILAEIIQKDKNLNKKYEGTISDSIYAVNEQEFGDIKDMIVSIFCYDKDFDESVINGLDINKSRNIYSIREKNIDHMIKEYGVQEAKREYLKKQYQKVHKPFKYAPAESWKTMGLYATTYSMILLIVISFFAAGLFSEEFRLGADSIFFSTKMGRSRGTKIKIATGLIMATIIYWGAMLIMSIISFGVMGISGASSPIQIEDSYCMYAYTFAQKYMIMLLSGYVGVMLAVVITMLVSAKTHSLVLAMCFPLSLFILSPFIGRVLPFKKFFNITPDQLINVYNCIKLPLLYQFGETVVMQIPMLMTMYSIIAIMIMPFIYRSFNKYYDK